MLISGWLSVDQFERGKQVRSLCLKNFKKLLLDMNNKDKNSKT
jgi:hypothetical protein